MNPKSNLFQELNFRQIEAIMQKHLPNYPVIEASLLYGGLFNTTYLIKTNKETFVLRLGPINRHLLLPYEKNLMNSEAYVNKLCKDASIPVPDMIACDTTKELIDRDYMIVSYLKSKSLSSLERSKQEKDRLYEQTGYYAHRMHQITGKTFGRVAHIVNGKSFPTWYDYIENEIHEFKQLAMKIPLYSNEDYQNIDAILQTNKDLLNEITVPHLVHCDLWEGNVLVSLEEHPQVIAIIDSDRAIFGDIDFEFASDWMINESFIKGYGSPMHMDAKSIKRRKIYSLIYNLNDSLVCLIQYNNEKNSNANKNGALELISELKEK